MEIINLTKDHETDYFVCLEDWSPDMQEAGNHRKLWYEKMKEKGLGVKLALNEAGKAVGMIQYVPIEYAFVEGRDLYFILCIWIHGYKNKGVGNNQKRGIGKALLADAEEDVREKGAKGIAAWGIPMPFWMRASWFKKQGYKPVDQEGFLGRVLLWKPFTDDAHPPRWISTVKEPELQKDKVTVTSYISGWCPGYNMVHERAKRACTELGGNVTFCATNTFENPEFTSCGNSDSLYINHKKVNIGPPPSYEKVKKKIEKELKRL